MSYTSTYTEAKPFGIRRLYVLNNCVANIDCKKIKLINQGDHVIFICKVNEVKINNKLKPLVYFDSNYA
jgi:flavin reductase (DIM6/NTAB) family NADH-FMN oxidoreductase RutF